MHSQLDIIFQSSIPCKVWEGQGNETPGTFVMHAEEQKYETPCDEHCTKGDKEAPKRPRAVQGRFPYRLRRPLDGKRTRRSTRKREAAAVMSVNHSGPSRFATGLNLPTTGFRGPTRLPLS
ncbi:hypothetical protein CDAR_421161 [Caerostris darwini]|uniref:Uncharacterized protein n=1 Tax=Caerostris darwini TaxID=1538125 RepID=A0AAV4RTJ1_9ARAC|nr:hypothetical protein CDAR_421161 [Caerostris darwini]